MGKAKPTDLVLVLRRGVKLARKVESAANTTSPQTAICVVAYGLLVRNRRLASAINRLGKCSAYEGRILVRSMVEIMINYAWIRHRKKHSRAVRFLRYEPLERLRIHRNMSTAMPPAKYMASKSCLEAERRKVRHLFRFRDRNGHMHWAKDWAIVNSVEARLGEIISNDKPAALKADLWLYSLYSLLSSAVHGGPISVQEVLAKRQDILVAARRPEPRPQTHLTGAAAVLAWTMQAAAEDLRINPSLRREVADFWADVQGLKPSGRIRETD